MIKAKALKERIDYLDKEADIRIKEIMELSSLDFYKSELEEEITQLQYEIRDIYDEIAEINAAIENRREIYVYV